MPMNRIKHVAICAKDQEKVAQFYEKVMGLKRVERAEEEGGMGGSRSIFLTDGYIALAIVPAGKEAERDVWLDHIGFIVEDGQGMYEQLKQEDVAVYADAPKPFYKVRALKGVDMDIATANRGWPGIAAD